MDNSLPSVPKTILLILDEKGEVAGTEQLATMLNMVNNKGWIIHSARLLEKKDLIHIITSRGGRSNKTIYKRNRNSPGAPRKRKSK